MKDSLISLKVSDELHDHIKELAKSKGVTMSDYVRKIIENAPKKGSA